MGLGTECHKTQNTLNLYKQNSISCDKMNVLQLFLQFLNVYCNVKWAYV